MLSSGMFIVGAPLAIATSVGALRSGADKSWALAALLLAAGSIAFYGLRAFSGVLFE